VSAALHGYIFPVKEGGKTRIAVIYAGTILTPDIISDQGPETHLRSVFLGVVTGYTEVNIARRKQQRRCDTT